LVQLVRLPDDTAADNYHNHNYDNHHDINLCSRRT